VVGDDVVGVPVPVLECDVVVVVVDPIAQEEDGVVLVPLITNVSIDLPVAVPVTCPPETFATVDPIPLVLLSERTAVAELGVKPLKKIVIGAAPAPLLMTTTAIDPSVFWKEAETTVPLLLAPQLSNITAPGRMYLENIPNAQSLPVGIAWLFSINISPAFEFPVWIPIQ